MALTEQEMNELKAELYDDYGSIRLPPLYTLTRNTRDSKNDAIKEFGQEYLQKIVQGINTASNAGSTSYNLPITATNGGDAKVKTAIINLGVLFTNIYTLSDTDKNGTNNYDTYDFKVKASVYNDSSKKTEEKTYSLINLTDENKTTINKSTTTLTSLEVDWSKATKNYTKMPKLTTFKLYYYDKTEKKYKELESSTSNMFEIPHCPDDATNKEKEDDYDLVVRLGFPTLQSAITDDVSLQVYYSTDTNRPLAHIGGDTEKEGEAIKIAGTNGYASYRIRGKYISKKTDNESADITNNRNRIILTFLNNDNCKQLLYLKVLPPPSAPAIPSNFKFVSSTTSEIKLSWRKIAEATNYKIYRSITESGTYTLLDTITNPTTENTTIEYSDTNLTSNTTYYYKIMASKVVQAKTYESSQSNAISARTKSAAPDKPTVTANAETSATIALTWLPVNGATAYDVYRFNGETYIRIAENYTETTFYSRSLSPNREYWYKVKAKNNDGESEFSTAVSAITLSA